METTLASNTIPAGGSVAGGLPTRKIKRLSEIKNRSQAMTRLKLLKSLEQAQSQLNRL